MTARDEYDNDDSNDANPQVKHGSKKMSKKEKAKEGTMWATLCAVMWWICEEEREQEGEVVFLRGTLMTLYFKWMMIYHKCSVIHRRSIANEDFVEVYQEVWG
jgi:hypothetical protein